MSKIVTNETLVSHLKSDIKLLGFPVDFDIVLKDCSETYFGRYVVQKKSIILYLSTDKGERNYTYEELLTTTLHEVIHHYQHHYEEGFVRYKGIMHDSTFKYLESTNLNKLARMGVISNAKGVSA